MPESLLDFLSRETDQKPSIVGRGILPVGSKAILGGAAKANKSFVVLNMAICLAKGIHLFDAKYKNNTPVFPVTKPWRVLLFEQEIGENGLRKRLKGFVSTEDALGAPLYIVSKDIKIRFDTTDGLTAIETHIANCKPDVVIFDPLSKFHAKDENSAQEMGTVMRVGDYLIQKYGCAIIYVHHTGLAAFDKESGRRDLAKLRGSSVVGADVDTFLELSRMDSAHSAEPLLQLSLVLRQGEPINPIYLRRRRSGWIDFVGEQSNNIGGGSSPSIGATA